MDDVDRAKEYEVAHRKRALSQALRSNQKNVGEEQLTNDQGDIICLDCNEVIPVARLEAWPDAVRCMPCKQSWENKNND